MLTDKFLSLTEELSSVRVERANIRVDLDKMTARMQRVNDNVGNSLSDVFTEVQNTYEDTIKAIKLKNQEDLVDG